MVVLGLTGPSGAGKGVVGDAFRAAGIPVLDTDAVYHEWICRPSPCTRELAKAFGDGILNEDGSVNRRRLASIVFCGTSEEEDRKKKLNAITHRYVLESCEVWLGDCEEHGARAAVIDAPLLIEAGLHTRCDRVLAVLAASETRLARIMVRDGIPYEAARARILAQPTDAFYREHAHFVFENDGAESEARRFVSQVLLDLPV